MPPTAPRVLSPNGVQSSPSYYDGLTSFAGTGVIARRGWNPDTTALITAAEGMAGNCAGLRFFAESAPLHLLRLLMEDATAQMAMDNDQTIGFAPGSTRIVALKDYRNGRGTVDDAGTAEINTLWARYDPTGGYGRLQSADADALMPLQRHALERVNDSGQYFFEAVIDRRGEGVSEILDFDPLTTRYRDEGTGKRRRRVLEQRTRAYAAAGLRSGWKELPRETIFTSSWRANRDMPYGGPRYGAWLRKGLAKIARSRNLSDWLHAVAWPRLVVQFPFDSAVKFAEEQEQKAIERGWSSFLKGAGPNGKDLDPYSWAQLQQEKFQLLLESLNSSDIMTIPTGGDVEVANASAITGIAEVFKMERVEEAQALLQLLNMLGITDGGTQAYADVQWTKYVTSITSVRNLIDNGLVGIGDLHFRSLGEDLICKVESEPIRPLDYKAVEEAEEIRLRNAERRVRMGFTTPEEEAIGITGSGLADEERANRFFAETEPAPIDPVPTQD